MNSAHDAIIVGACCAGSPAAMLLARRDTACAARATA
jgi:thioredoxin reductase